MFAETTVYFWGASNYSSHQRHSVVNLCDRRITLLSDTDISFGLFKSILILICLLGDSMQHSKCKRNFEDILIEQKIISKSTR